MTNRSMALLLMAALGAGGGCGESAGGDTDATPGSGSIEGVVSTQDGTPLGGVEIATSPSTGFAVTGAAGGYAIANVPPGSYQVSASRSGYVPATKTADVSAGGVGYVDFRLEPEVVPGMISGRVTDSATGGPIAGAAVMTDPASSQVTTDADGRYMIADLAAGSYQVHAEAAGYAPGDGGPAAVNAGQTTTVDLQLVAIVTYASTCAGCHVSEAKLLADLEADPPPEPPPSGSEGEG